MTVAPVWINIETNHLTPAITRINENVTAHVWAATIKSGNLDEVKAHEKSIGENTSLAMEIAAYYGHADVARWIYATFPRLSTMCSAILAAREGHLNYLEWLVPTIDQGSDAYTIIVSAFNGHFECVKFLYRSFTTPSIPKHFNYIVEEATAAANEKNYSEISEWLTFAFNNH